MKFSTTKFVDKSTKMISTYIFESTNFVDTLFVNQRWQIRRLPALRDNVRWTIDFRNNRR